MKARKGLLFLIAFLLWLTLGPTPGIGQPLSGPPADPRYKYSTPLPPGLAIPNQVETRLGTLRFFAGNPDEATTQKLFDNLDFQRAVQAYLLALPGVSQVFNRQAILAMGPVNHTIPFWEDFVDSRTVEFLANHNTPYLWFWTDLRQGPLVVEVPPKVLGMVNDMWQHWVTDMGITGRDKGKGGKYLLLPPGYQGTPPEGYHVARPRTFSNLVILRCLPVKGDSRPGMETAKKLVNVYPLAQAANPTKATIVNMSGKPFNMIYPSNDPVYWELLNQVVQQEPSESLDQIRLGYFASIGIQKGKPFAPDERMKKILAEAAIVGEATARAVSLHTRDQGAYYYPKSTWQRAFFGGYKFQPSPGVLSLDSYIFYFFMSAGVTPAMEMKMIGRGSQYAWTSRDAAGNPLDGGKNYKLHLPPNIPAKIFWSVIVYSNQTRSMIQSDQRQPAIGDQTEGLAVNPDGSVDVYFGPGAPAGKEHNWVQTLPGESWLVILRLYGPLEPWFNRTWRPGEIELRP
jgi:hypothetical protein